MKKALRVLMAGLLTVILFSLLQMDEAFAAPVEYDVWVGGVRVTSANADDVLAGSKSSGEVRFRPAQDGAPARLILNNANIQQALFPTMENMSSLQTRNACILALIPLEIQVHGENNVLSHHTEKGLRSSGIYSLNKLWLTGDGRLQINGVTNEDGPYSASILAYGDEFHILGDIDLQIKQGSALNDTGITGLKLVHIGDSARVNIEANGRFAEGLRCNGSILIDGQAEVKSRGSGEKFMAVHAQKKISLAGEASLAAISDAEKGIVVVANESTLEMTDKSSLLVCGGSKLIYSDVLSDTFPIYPDAQLMVAYTPTGVGLAPWDGVTPIARSETYRYLQVTPPGYRILFDLNDGGLGQSPKPGRTEKDGRLTTLPEPKRKGYLFQGWYDNKEGSGEAVTTTRVFKGESTLYAKWKKDENAPAAQVSFDYNYEKAPKAMVLTTNEQGQLTTLPKPTREGFLFQGWYEDKAASGKAVTTTKVFQGGEILYAKWKKADSTANKTKVKMIINSPVYFVNDQSRTMDTSPVIRQSRTYVPYRALGEAFGAKVVWEGQQRTVTAQLGNQTIVMTIGAKTYTVNGIEKTMDVAPYIQDSRTMIPVRFAGEALGFQVTPTYHADGTTATVEFANK